MKSYRLAISIFLLRAAHLHTFQKEPESSVYHRLLQATETPSLSPTLSSQPSSSPSDVPSLSPSAVPSSLPSDKPSSSPTLSSQPSSSTSDVPSLSPSAVPSPFPSQIPSLNPSLSAIPSESPSSHPTSLPSISLSPTSTCETFTNGGQCKKAPCCGWREGDPNIISKCYFISDCTPEGNCGTLKGKACRDQSCCKWSKGQCYNELGCTPPPSNPCEALTNARTCNKNKVGCCRWKGKKRGCMSVPNCTKPGKPIRKKKTKKPKKVRTPPNTANCDEIGNGGQCKKTACCVWGGGKAGCMNDPQCRARAPQD